MVPITLLYNLSSFVIVLHHGCQLFETSVMVAVDKESNVTKQNWWKCRLPLLSTAEAMRQRHESLHGVEKNSATPPHAILLPHRMNGIRHLYFLHSRFLLLLLLLLHCIRTACMESSVLHVWNHSLKVQYERVMTLQQRWQQISSTQKIQLLHVAVTWTDPCGSDMNWSMWQWRELIHVEVTQICTAAVTTSLHCCNTEQKESGIHSLSDFCCHCCNFWTATAPPMWTCRLKTG